MYNDYLKIELESKYAVGKRDLVTPFIILEDGAVLIFDELLKVDEREFDFKLFCEEFSEKYKAPRDIIQEDVKLVLDVLNSDNLSIKDAAIQYGEGNTYQIAFSHYNQQNKIFKVFIELTYACNLKCGHCYLGTDINSIQTKINFANAKRLLDQLYEAGTVDITFTGGECFCNPDALEIIQYACDKKFIVSILTNGTLVTEEKAAKLAELPISGVRISVYGLEEFHDKFVGVKGAFGKSFNALKCLNRQRPGFALATTVVTKDNYNEIIELHKLLEDNNIGHKITPLIYPTAKGDLGPTKLRISQEQIIELHEKGLFEVVGNTCGAGRSRFRITPHGDMNPCELFRNVIFGNVFKQSVNEVLFSEIRQEWLEKLNDALNNCECSKCENKETCPKCIGIGYLENGNFYDKPKAICQLAKAKKESAARK